MANEESKNTHHLNTEGLSCPEPVMLLHAAVRDAVAGDLIVVRATDPATERDFSKFCNFLGHTIISLSKDDGVLIYEIEKGVDAG